MSNVDEQKFHLKQEADCILESARNSNLSPHVEPFISQQTKTTVEINSLKMPPTSSINPNAIPFFSSSQSRTHGSNFESIGQQQQEQEQPKTVLGKRKFGESKQEDIEVYKARKENNEEEPPRKIYWTLIKVYFRNPFIPPTTNNVEAAEQSRESKSKVEEQPVILENIMAQNKRASTIGTVKRSSHGPATNKAKKVVKTAAKTAERIKCQEKRNKKREEIKKRKEISRQIDREALEIRKIKAQQLQNLDNDIVSRDKFIQAYAERLEHIKQQRYANRIQQKLSPCHSCVYRETC